MTKSDDTSLRGQILIAMPGMEDSRFHRTVIYICEHTAQGTMGIVLNRPMQNMTFKDILHQVHVVEDEETQLSDNAQQVTVYKGGPVETGRGFVLHSSDYHLEGTTRKIDDAISLTETLEVLKALADGTGPEHAFLALGYAGWTAGQLEKEIQQNGWLHGNATQDLLFGKDFGKKYNGALAELGINPALLSTSSGHA